jgi:hypothetical protein
MRAEMAGSDLSVYRQGLFITYNEGRAQVIPLNSLVNVRTKCYHTPGERPRLKDPKLKPDEKALVYRGFVYTEYSLDVKLN